MNKLFKNPILKKIFYWFSALAILILFPTLTILFLRLGTIFNPLGLLIRIGLYIFCGGFTIVGFIAIILFFYESLISKFIGKKNIRNQKE